MSYLRVLRKSYASGRAIIASAAVAVLVLMVCSAVLEPRGWPVSLVVRSHFATEAGGSWGAPWESLAREPAAYQSQALVAMGRTVWQIALCAELIAVLALVLHTVSLVVERWHQLAIRAALGAPLRSLLKLVGGELLKLGAAGAALGIALGTAALALLKAGWPRLLSVVPLAGHAAIAAVIAVLATFLLLGAIVLVLLTLLSRGSRLAAELHGTQVTRGAGVQFIQTSLAALQLAALLVVTYACTLILEAGSLPPVKQAGIDAESLLAAPAQVAGAADVRSRAGVYRRSLLNLPQSPRRRVALSSPDAWLGIGKELPVLAFCGECRRGMYPTPMTSARIRVVAMSPDVLEPIITYRWRSARDLSLNDTTGARRPVLINMAAVYQLFPAGNPLGKTIRTSLAGGWEYTVVGVTSVAAPEVFGTPPQTPLMFVSVLQHPPERAELSAPGASWDFASWLAAAVPADALQVGQPRSLADRLRDFSEPIKWFALLFAGLSLAATGTATYSLIAVMNQLVRLRERDIAIRVAVGATARDIERWVLGRTMWITLSGAVIGLSGARWVGTMMRGADNEADIAWLGAMLLAFAALGLVAAWLPARRAARVQPAVIWAKAGN